MCNPDSDPSTPDGAEQTENTSTMVDTIEPTDRIRDHSAPLYASLPTDLQRALGAFLNQEPVETVAEWTEAVRTLTGGGSIAIEDLCHAAEHTPHYGEVGGQRYHFECFYDAVVLAAVRDEPVAIHTKSPDGSVIEAQALGSDDLAVEPQSALYSFGIDDSAAVVSDQSPTLATGYKAICPYVKAFPDPTAYTIWVDSIDAPTVAFPLSGATAIAKALVE